MSVCLKHFRPESALQQELFVLEDETPPMSLASEVVTRLKHDARLKKAHLFWLNFTKIALVYAIIIALVLTLIMIASYKIEITVDISKWSKMITQVPSIGIVRWILYALHLFLRRRYPTI